MSDLRVSPARFSNGSQIIEILMVYQMFHANIFKVCSMLRNQGFERHTKGE